MKKSLTEAILHFTRIQATYLQYDKVKNQSKGFMNHGQL